MILRFPSGDVCFLTVNPMFPDVKRRFHGRDSLLHLSLRDFAPARERLYTYILKRLAPASGASVIQFIGTAIMTAPMIRSCFLRFADNVASLTLVV